MRSAVQKKNRPENSKIPAGFIGFSTKFNRLRWKLFRAWKRWRIHHIIREGWWIYNSIMIITIGGAVRLFMNGVNKLARKHLHNDTVFGTSALRTKMTNYSVLKWTAFLVKRATFDVYVNMKVYKNIKCGQFFNLYIFSYTWASLRKLQKRQKFRECYSKSEEK